MSPDRSTRGTDGSNPGTLNGYTYVLNDPVNHIDPNGLDYCLIDGNPIPGMNLSECEEAGGQWVLGDPPGCNGIGGGFLPDGADPDPCPTPQPPPSPPKTPPCPPQFQAWINSYGADALAAGLPEANTLALSAIETGWGTGRFARQGNDFFNLETCWAPRKPQPAFKYEYQVGWIQAQLPSDSCGKGLHFALVASYASVLNSFLSVAATFDNLNVPDSDPATFAQHAAADGIYAGNSPGFLATQQTFVNCLTGQ
jgi:hypothetical protein